MKNWEVDYSYLFVITEQSHCWKQHIPCDVMVIPKNTTQHNPIAKQKDWLVND